MMNDDIGKFGWDSMQQLRKKKNKKNIKSTSLRTSSRILVYTHALIVIMLNQNFNISANVQQLQLDHGRGRCMARAAIYEGHFIPSSET